MRSLVITRPKTAASGPAMSPMSRSVSSATTSSSSALSDSSFGTTGNGWFVTLWRAAEVPDAKRAAARVFGALAVGPAQAGGRAGRQGVDPIGRGGSGAARGSRLRGRAAALHSPHDHTAEIPRRERGARVTGPRRGSRLASHSITRYLIPEDYGATVLSHYSDV